MEKNPSGISECGIKSSIKNIVRQAWNTEVQGVKMYKVVCKLKAVKKELIKLNKEGFQDIIVQEHKAFSHLNERQSALHLTRPVIC